ncbi:MAG: tRNA uridine-5-carboxymethylaminomethyl(34) synthesis GTPase MnmE [Planctomycetes bacterium]|nr:tRNA uridine-5-carboxymethylaminomethyl(34) synthesis GTPase MnmE [Planctomycetota bacterium]
MSITLQLDDTIAALASAPGPAARGIIRISGPDSKNLLENLFQADTPDRWKSQKNAFRHSGCFHLSDSHVDVPLDVCLWPTQRSFTGQPIAELHLVGSPPLLEAVLSELYQAGIRPAKPGEFTLRAFLAGRIDLVQAEAVLGVIDAHTDRELKTALNQLAGGLSERIAEVRNGLLNLLADLEAGLDFVEDDIEFIEPEELNERIEQSKNTLAELLEQASNRMQSTGRLRVVLAGLPNAGKSTLFNMLAGEEAALVSEIQGTTRDYLRSNLNWNGTAIELIDTAGWESAATQESKLNHLAQYLRNEQLQQADLVVWCSAADFTGTERRTESRLLAELGRQKHSVLIVLTKCDVPVTEEVSAAVKVSAHLNEGVNELRELATSALSEPQQSERQLVGTTAARSRESLQGCVDSLERAQQAAETQAGDELVALEVRAALDHLGAILGAVYTDDILDRIFSRFCIGK